MSTKRSSYFTLTELLVVVSLMLTFASFIHPSLTSVLQNSKKLTCLKNQKDLGFATMLYVNDHDDYLPVGLQYETGVIDKSWDESLMNYLIPVAIPEDVLSEFKNSNQNWWYYGRDYGDQPSSLICPNHVNHHDFVYDKYAWVRSYLLIGRRAEWDDLSYNNKSEWFHLMNGPSYINFSHNIHNIPIDTYYLSEAHHTHNMVGNKSDQLNLRHSPEMMADNGSIHNGSEWLPHPDFEFNFLYIDGYAKSEFIFEHGRTWKERSGPWTMRADD